MKKIMFDDKLLMPSILNGQKTMTRRLVLQNDIDYALSTFRNDYFNATLDALTDIEAVRCCINEQRIRTPYGIGEVVAVAQSYRNAGLDPMSSEPMFFSIPTIIPEVSSQPLLGWHKVPLKYHKGWGNKMFVRADLMPHQISITGIKVERLQDISEEDVYKEGFSKICKNNGWGNAAYHWETVLVYYDTLGRTKEIGSRHPREAFAILIDKVSGIGTWEHNPYVYAYTFKLIK